MRWIAAAINIICLLAGLYSIHVFWPTEDLKGIDYYIFPVFLSVFCIILAVATSFHILRRIERHRKPAIYILNAFIILLFVVTIAYSNRAFKEGIIDNPIEMVAVVYKIDAVSLDAPSSVFYMYIHKGVTYQNSFSDELREFNVGDSLIIKMSTDNPQKSKMLRLLDSENY